MRGFRRLLPRGYGLADWLMAWGRPPVPFGAAGGVFPRGCGQRPVMGRLPSAFVLHELCALRGPLPALVPDSLQARAAAEPAGAGAGVRAAGHCEPLQDLLPHGTPALFRCDPAGRCAAGGRGAGAGHQLYRNLCRGRGFRGAFHRGGPVGARPLALRGAASPAGGACDGRFFRRCAPSRWRTAGSVTIWWTRPGPTARCTPPSPWRITAAR